MMTLNQFIGLRTQLGLTQGAMAAAMGMPFRTYQDIERGESTLRPVYVLAAERAALAEAAKRGDPMLAPASVRRDAMTIAGALAGTAPIMVPPPTILASKAGATLTQVMLGDGSRELDRVYFVTSERQPRAIYAGSDKEGAWQAYEAEVAAIARIRNNS
jgi:DNA-binding XRE family transcriptional regulator